MITANGVALVEGGSCPFCMAEGCGSMRQDKKGRPYFFCIGCGTRAFIHSAHAYKTFQWILSTGMSYARMSVAAVAPKPVEVMNVPR